MNDASGGVLRQARDLAAAVLALLHNRVELAGTELEITLRVLAGRVVWGLIAIAFGFLSLTMGSVLVLVLAWESHRVAAVVGLALFYGVAAAVAAYAAIARRHAPAMLEATLGELRRDIDALRGPR